MNAKKTTTTQTPQPSVSPELEAAQVGKDAMESIQKPVRNPRKKSIRVSAKTRVKTMPSATAEPPATPAAIVIDETEKIAGHPLSSQMAKERLEWIAGQLGRFVLTPEEQAKLETLEERVSKAQSSFVELIDGLTAIQEFMKKRDGFRMNAYVRDRFDINPVTWTRYQDAQRIFAIFRETNVELPNNEGQARMLATVRKAILKKLKGAENSHAATDAKLVEIWQKALAAAKSKAQRVTAQAIAETAEMTTKKKETVEKELPLQDILQKVEFLARKSTAKDLYLTVVARCTLAAANDFRVSSPCVQNQLESGDRNVFEFRDFSAQMDGVLDAVSAWLVTHKDVMSCQINIVRK
jgi:hypothetical protein